MKLNVKLSPSRCLALSLAFFFLTMKGWRPGPTCMKLDEGVLNACHSLLCQETTVGLLKRHQADVMARALSGDKRKLVPRVSDLILQVIAQCKKQGGITMVELKKALAAGGYDVGKNNTRVNRAVKGLVRTETLLRTPGTAVSYKFNSKTMVCTV